MLWKTSLRQFSKEAKFRISLDQQSKVITEVKAIEKYIESKVRTTCFYPEQSFFKNKTKQKKQTHTHKNKTRSVVSLPASFSA